MNFISICRTRDQRCILESLRIKSNKQSDSQQHAERNKVKRQEYEANTTRFLIISTISNLYFALNTAIFASYFCRFPLSLCLSFAIIVEAFLENPLGSLLLWSLLHLLHFCCNQLDRPILIKIIGHQALSYKTDNITAIFYNRSDATPTFSWRGRGTSTTIRESWYCGLTCKLASV